MARVALLGFAFPFGRTAFTILAMVRACWVPSGSMKSALLMGDYALANRLAFGVQELLCTIRTSQDDMGRDVVRGDVATFRHPIIGQHYVKGVAGLAGDCLQMRKGRIFLNDEVVTDAPMLCLISRGARSMRRKFFLSRRALSL